MPLEELVRPVALAEWIEGDAGLERTVEAATAVGSARHGAAGPLSGSLDDPFTDDPQPTVTAGANESSPIESAADAAEQTGGKIPSGKLLGIVGRALRRSVPVPSLDSVRDKIPYLATPQEDGDSFGAGDGFDEEFQSATADGADPFGAAPAEFESSPAETDETGTPAGDAETAEEDPFGGF
jgi:hypothetical protein